MTDPEYKAGREDLVEEVALGLMLEDTALMATDRKGRTFLGGRTGKQNQAAVCEMCLGRLLGRLCSKGMPGFFFFTFYFQPIFDLQKSCRNGMSFLLFLTQLPLMLTSYRMIIQLSRTGN